MAPTEAPLSQPPAGSDLPAALSGADTLSGIVGSPLKKARPSMHQSVSGDKLTSAQSLSAALGAAVGEASTSAPAATSAPAPPKMDEEEEL